MQNAPQNLKDLLATSGNQTSQCILRFLVQSIPQLLKVLAEKGAHLHLYVVIILGLITAQ